MSKLKKLLIVLFATPILLVIIAIVAVSLFANAAARKGIEAGATYALGVNTTLGSASVGLLSGKFGLSNLKVANVQGYKADKFMSLGEGNVAVSLGSLMQDTIEIPTFSLDTIEMNLEKKDGKANYKVIMDNLAKLSKGKEPAPKPAEKGPGKKLVIRELTIRHVVVNADLVPVGGGVKIPIDEIKLQNVGQGVGGSGVTIEQLSSIIVQAVLSAAVENGGGLLPADVLGDLKGSLDQLGDLKGIGKSVQEGTKEIEKLGEGLKGILPGSKKK